jgi:hypothetical protein
MNYSPLAVRLPHDHCGTGAAVLEANRVNYKGDLAMSENEILDLEDKRFGAMIKGDFNGLDAMVHEQLLYAHSFGNTDTKPSWLESMKSGRTKYKAVNCSDRKVRVFGDVALITGVRRSKLR